MSTRLLKFQTNDNQNAKYEAASIIILFLIGDGNVSSTYTAEPPCSCCVLPHYRSVLNIQVKTDAHSVVTTLVSSFSFPLTSCMVTTVQHHFHAQYKSLSILFYHASIPPASLHLRCLSSLHGTPATFLAIFCSVRATLAGYRLLAFDEGDILWASGKQGRNTQGAILCTSCFFQIQWLLPSSSLHQLACLLLLSSSICWQP